MAVALLAPGWDNPEVLVSYCSGKSLLPAQIPALEHGRFPGRGSRAAGMFTERWMQGWRGAERSKGEGTKSWILQGVGWEAWNGGGIFQALQQLHDPEL